MKHNFEPSKGTLFPNKEIFYASATAATDGMNRLRSLAGKDVSAISDNRTQMSDEAYIE